MLSSDGLDADAGGGDESDGDDSDDGGGDDDDGSGDYDRMTVGTMELVVGN